jgi:serine kinase of HPr protein (carbohydrate metabolism regulator)
MSLAPVNSLSSETLHASAVAIDGRAVLIEGRSGAGKSDLALRLIDRGAALVSDDYTICVRDGKAVLATAPANTAGKIEIRGIGIVPHPYIDRVPIALLVCVDSEAERMPEPRSRRIAGIEVAEIALAPLEPSAPIKVEWALRRLASA